MPAYSYQKQFVPMIEDESKGHTVRAQRKPPGRHVKPGERFSLYTGMRTKGCMKIGEATCSSIQKIKISEGGIYIGGEVGTMGWDCPKDALMVQQFAWKDGFRPKGSTVEHPQGSFDLMLQWFQKTHELPFEGVVIYWKDFRKAVK